VYDLLVNKSGFYYAVQNVEGTGKELTPKRIMKAFVHSVNESGVLGEYGYDDDAILTLTAALSVFHAAYRKHDGKWVLQRS
jgi:hypothetical protein